MRRNGRMPETFEMDSNGDKLRPKRGIAPAVAVGFSIAAFIIAAVTGVLTAWNYICDWIRASQRTEELEKSKKI
ncbi:hypothetical protein GCK72_015491 [Caenorhabditis remanei]|uniref:Uncharacterized protein n=1 Tax=Caenorhabditis remanei TaxID=31234 RepID=A0A6A5GWN5_CAERE|nr:hypothetical protein GCK72_015491 [Caenorhabditis remanei]KAF1759031.1 hypothetical protein GCK72_015491 [Caenorhabditis remanei]